TPSQSATLGQPVPQARPSLELSPSSGTGGTHVTAKATGFAAGGLVQIYFQGGLVGQATASAQGAAEISFTVPPIFSRFPPGQPVTVSAFEQATSAQQIFTLS